MLEGAGHNLLGPATKIGTESWHVVSLLAQRQFVRPMLNYLVDVAIDGNLTSHRDRGCLAQFPYLKTFHSPFVLRAKPAKHCLLRRTYELGSELGPLNGFDHVPT